MDVIKYLIGFFFKLAFGAIFVALVWWLVSLLFPALSFSQVKQLVHGDVKKDILPSPREYAKMFKPAPTPYANKTPGVYGTEFSGYGTIKNSEVIWGTSPKWGSAEFITYSTGNGAGTSANSQVIQPTQQANSQPSRSLYIRNLSIYEGGNISTSLTFIGEARDTMYKNGAFPILIINQHGNVIGVSNARATGAWAIPGWSRFEVVISHPLPPGGVPCAVIFEQAKATGDTTQPVRVGVPVKCN